MNALDITSAFNVPTTSGLLTSDNSGSNLDYSAGSPDGTATTAITGNSLLDGIAQFSALAVNTVTKGLSSYGSFLESEAVANAAQRLNTTPTAIVGSLPTVPLTSAQIAQQADATKQYILWAGAALIALVVVVKVIRK